MTLQEKRDQIEAYLLQLGYAVKIIWSNINLKKAVFQSLFTDDVIRTSEKYNFTTMSHWQYHWNKLVDFPITEHPLEDHLLAELENRIGMRDGIVED